MAAPDRTGDRLNYTFTGNWSPRLGATVDPFGKGKTKIYYNFGRFHEFIPLDLAERSLSAESGFIGARYAPEYVLVGGVRRALINQYGTVNPVVSSANLLSRATGGFPNTGITISLQDPHNPILPGTKLGYAQEHLFGFEHQLPGNMVVSIRYIDRRLKRIVEDAAVVPPEGAAFFGQTYFIGNVNASLDAAVNPIGVKFTPTFDSGGNVNNVPVRCRSVATDPTSGDFVNSDLGICFQPLGANGQPAGDSGADGVPDGFPDPVHNYRAVEIELNKRFSNNWQLLANWRIAKLDGNFEGHFRNDNGQTDPAISSLFDFTAVTSVFSAINSQSAQSTPIVDTSPTSMGAMPSVAAGSAICSVDSISAADSTWSQVFRSVNFSLTRSTLMPVKYRLVAAASWDGLISSRDSICTPTIHSRSTSASHSGSWRISLM